MGLFSPSRERRGPDPYYRWKVACFAAGAAVAFFGMFGHHDRLILVAVPILAVGVALRWLPRPGRAPDAQDEQQPAPAESGQGSRSASADESDDGGSGEP